MGKRIDKDAATRATTGVVFLAVMISGLLISPLSVLLLFAIITVVATFEYARITKAVHPPLYAGTGVLAFMMGAMPMSSLALGALGLICLAVILLPYRKSPYNFGRNVALRSMGLVLIPVAFAVLRNCGDGDTTGNLLLFFFIFLWTNDTMAYVTGRLLGKRKLWPRISPGKTWEGFVGGVIWACIVGAIFHHYIDLSTPAAMGMAAVVGIGGTMGDLIESSLKRRAGVKDSGSFMPGHGGMLDRFDGVMIAAPLVYIYLHLIAM